MKFNLEIQKQKDSIRYTEAICEILGPKSAINDLLPVMRKRLEELEHEQARQEASE